MSNDFSTSMVPTMMATSSYYGRNMTFRLIPISPMCPYMECLYDPETKVFAIISKIAKSTYHMLPTLDDHGDEKPAKKKRPGGKKIMEERRLVDSFQEFYMFKREEIDAFLKGICINPDYDFATYLDAPPANPMGPGKPVAEELDEATVDKIKESIESVTDEQIVEATKEG